MPKTTLDIGWRHGEPHCWSKTGDKEMIFYINRIPAVRLTLVKSKLASGVEINDENQYL